MRIYKTAGTLTLTSVHYLSSLKASFLCFILYSFLYSTLSLSMKSVFVNKNANNNSTRTLSLSSYACIRHHHQFNAPNEVRGKTPPARCAVFNDVAPKCTSFMHVEGLALHTDKTRVALCNLCTGRTSCKQSHRSKTSANINSIKSRVSDAARNSRKNQYYMHGT